MNVELQNELQQTLVLTLFRLMNKGATVMGEDSYRTTQNTYSILLNKHILKISHRMHFLDWAVCCKDSLASTHNPLCMSPVSPIFSSSIIFSQCMAYELTGLSGCVR